MKKFLIINKKSFSDFGVSTVKELWEKASKEYGGLILESKAEFKKSASDGNKYHAVFSSANTDRHMDIVFQNFELSNFAKNPVFLDSHNYDSIEHIIGRVEDIRVENAMLQGDVVFAMENPKGILAQRLVDGGFLNTTSIGFIPLEFDNSGNISKSELLEISAVSVPANADALFDKKNIDKIAVEQGMALDKTSMTQEIKERKTPIAFKAAVKLNVANEKLLKSIVKNLTEMRPSNKGEKQRKIFKAVREAFK